MQESIKSFRDRAGNAWKSACDLLGMRSKDALQLVRRLIEPLDHGGDHPARGYTDLPDIFYSMTDTAIRDLQLSDSTRVLDLVLLELAGQFDSRFEQAKLPESLLPYYRENLDRILVRAAQAHRWATTARSDIFLKDLGILRMTLIPCSSHLVFRNSGVPRSLLLRQNPLNLALALRFFGLRTHGFAPFLENHVHPQMLEHFNPEGRARCYELVAELLERWPENRGLMGMSWYYDPVVRTISPRLAYLRDVPERGGALFLPAGRGKDVAAGAVAKSQTRRRLFEAGKYEPVSYLMAWASADIQTRSID